MKTNMNVRIGCAGCFRARLCEGAIDKCWDGYECNNPNRANHRILLNAAPAGITLRLTTRSRCGSGNRRCGV